ncbi:MAG TPA: GrpB family protein [Edaphobacter sp.]
MDEIHIVDYDPRWSEMYAAEAKRLQSVLPVGLVSAIEHFGSTAIPGLVAKPIIDILVAVRSVREAREIAMRPMEVLGYAFWSDNPQRDRLFFVKGLPPAAPHRTHHVHITELGSDMWERLLFRDYLRTHPDEASHYGALKLELMAQYKDDREAYTTAKTTYVYEVMSKARAMRAG